MNNTMNMIQDQINWLINQINVMKKNKYDIKLYLNYMEQKIVNFTNIINRGFNLMNQNISLSNPNSINISN